MTLGASHIYLQKYFFLIYSLFPVACCLLPKSDKFLALFKIEMHR